MRLVVSSGIGFPDLHPCEALLRGGHVRAGPGKGSAGPRRCRWRKGCGTPWSGSWPNGTAHNPWGGRHEST